MAGWIRDRRLAGLALAVLLAAPAAAAPPLRADAGPDQTAQSGATVVLDGSGGDYPYAKDARWTLLEGSVPQIRGLDRAVMSFDAPNVTGASPATVRFRLTLTDDQGGRYYDDVTITVLPLNRAPTADAGPGREAAPGDVVLLNGTGSFDPEGSPLSFLWSQAGGPPVNLTGADSARASFVAPPAHAGEPVDLLFRLVVDDGNRTSAADVVRVRVSQPPDASLPTPTISYAAGRDNLTLNFTAPRLGGPIAYQWDFGDGNVSQERDPAHTFREPGSYEVRVALVAADGSVHTFRTTVEVGELTEPAPAVGGTPRRGGDQPWLVPAATGLAAALALAFVAWAVLSPRKGRGNEIRFQRLPRKR